MLFFLRVNIVYSLECGNRGVKKNNKNFQTLRGHENDENICLLTNLDI